jgi:hypothetical protein
MLTTDFISADDGASSGTGFNFRFATLLPSRHNWLTPIFGVNIVPYGTTGFTNTNTNSPSVFIGNVFPLIAKRRLGGWLQIDVPILWYYTHDGGGSSNQRLFGKDFYFELAMTMPLGERLFKELGPGWNRLEAYLLFDQNLTPNENTVSAHTDRFNPVALYGVSIRLGKGT